MKAIYVFSCILMVLSIGHPNAQPLINQPDQETYINDFQGEIFKKIHNAEKVEPLALFLSLDSKMTKEKYQFVFRNFEAFCVKLKAKKSRRYNERFLKYVFYKVHNEYLKNYKLNSPTYSTFETGNYDCVSGTAIYALILDKLEIPYTIRETKFHAYLTTSFNNKTQLWETTDPLEGWTNDPEEVKKKELHYQQQVEQNENYYVYKGIINENINLVNLAGLEYYNEGIVSYNNQKIETSLGQFEKSLHLYNCGRIQDMFKMGLQALARELHYSKSTGLAQSYNYFSKVVSH